MEADDTEHRDETEKFASFAFKTQEGGRLSDQSTSYLKMND